MSIPFLGFDTALLKHKGEIENASLLAGMGVLNVQVTTVIRMSPNVCKAEVVEFSWHTHSQMAESLGTAFLQ